MNFYLLVASDGS